MNTMTKLALGVMSIALHGAATASESSEKARCLALSDISQAESCLRASEQYLGRVARGVDGQNVIADKPTRIEGDYAEYLGDNLSGIQSPLLAKALENEGKKLVVRVGAPDPVSGAYAVYLSSADDGYKHYQGAVLASNQGLEITGRDIISWYNRARLGEGYVLISSLTHGISDFHAVSKGGKYEAAFLGLEKAQKFGLLEVQYLYALNEPGGESRLYDLGGETNRLSLSLTNWMDPSLSLKNQISYTHREQDFGAFSLTETQKFWMYRPVITYSNGVSSVSLSLSKGLGGTQDYNLIPLMGTFNPHFWSGQIDGSTHISLPENVMLNARISGFTGSEDMPSSERFRLGGSGAGSSHENGIYSGYEGFSYEIDASKYLGQYRGISFLTKLGLNGANVVTATDNKLGVNAGQIGLSARYQNFTVDTSWSRSLSTKGLEADSRAAIELAWRY